MFELSGKTHFGHRWWMLLLLLSFAYGLWNATAMAGGINGHNVASELARQHLADAQLRDLLSRNGKWYFAGTVFPDVVLNILQIKKDPESDGKSHVRTGTDWLSPSRPPVGIAVEYWKSLINQCPDIQTSNPPFSADCEKRLAFYFGMVSHLVVDGPWHNQFIDVSDNGSDTLNFCKAPAVNRHQMADTKFDACLAMAMTKELSTVAIALDTATLNGLPKICPDGTFLDPRNGGECWSCPNGTSRTLSAVDQPDACAGDQWKSAQRMKNTTWPSDCWGTPGWFHDAWDYGACWTCNGWSRSVEPVYSGKACFSNTKTKATYVSKVSFSCPSGQISFGGGCFSCPAGFFFTAGACVMAVANKCPFNIVPPIDTLPRLEMLGWSDPAILTAVDALNADGTRIDEATYLAEYTLFAEGLSKILQTAMVLTSEDTSCKWLYEHAVDGRGGLKDAAAEATRTIDAVWKLRSVGKRVNVVRTTPYEYAVVLDGENVYATWDRDCPKNPQADWFGSCRVACIPNKGPTGTRQDPWNGCTTPNRSLILVHRATGKCLDPSMFDGAANRPLGLYECDGGLDQVFRYTRPAGELVNGASGNCLDVSGINTYKTVGNTVALYACDDGTDQKWSFTQQFHLDQDLQSSLPLPSTVLDAPRWTAIRSGHKDTTDGACLGVNSSQTAVQLVTCDPNDQYQLWAPVPLPARPRSEGSYIFVNKQRGGCLDPAFSSGAAGVLVGLYPCDEGADQAFVANSTSTGVVTLSSVPGKGCLATSGTGLQLSTCDGSTPNWSWTQAGWGTLKTGNSCVAADSKNGTKATLEACGGTGDTQQWVRIKVPK